MPTMTATGNLSARLRLAQGHHQDDVVEVPEKQLTQRAQPTLWHGDGSQCTWSVMAGQRCNRSAVAGVTFCRNHLAMIGTPAARPTSRV